MHTASLAIVREARLENLPALREFIENACHQMALDAAICFDFKLAVDEVCANIILHGYDQQPPGPIQLTFHADDHQAVVTITDYGLTFDPTSAPPPDLASDWQERHVGGLGVYFVRETMDELTYQPNMGQGNCLTLIKRLTPAQPSSATIQPRSIPMELTIQQQGPVAVVAIAGSLDALSAEEVTKFLSAQVSGGITRLVTDFALVDYVSSAGLRTLLATLKEARQLGGDLRLAAIQPSVRKVLDLSGFTSILKVYPSVEAAVASFTP